MKHLKKFESFSNDTDNGMSLEDKKLYIMDCGYTDDECEHMTPEEIEVCYQECRSMKNEAKKHKPDFLDIDEDGDKKEPMKKASKDKKGGISDKKKKKLPEHLLKAMEKRRGK